MPESMGTDYFLSTMLPNLLTLGSLMMVYILVPNKKVKFTHAFIGAILASIAFFIMRKFFGTFIASSVAYTTLYGALAAIPVLLVWLYFTWAVVIFGAAEHCNGTDSAVFVGYIESCKTDIALAHALGQIDTIASYFIATDLGYAHIFYSFFTLSTHIILADSIEGVTDETGASV